MGECSAGIAIGNASGCGLNDVQVVQDVVKAAVVWQPVEKGSNCVFHGHNNPRLPKRQSEYTAGRRRIQVLLAPSPMAQQANGSRSPAAAVR